MSKIKMLTVTGADDSVDYKQLLDLQFLYPFLEFGVLFYSFEQYRPRFPSEDWIRGLPWRELRLSLHLCSVCVEEAYRGDWSYLKNYFPYWFFKRCQLNTHGEWTSYTSCLQENFEKATKEFGWELIQRFDSEVPQVYAEGVTHLFDFSHGAGILPVSWPTVSNLSWVGYAGGLAPNNLSEQIPKILEACKGAAIWLDMETGVRENNKFSIEKVAQACDIVKEYIEVTCDD